MGIDVLTNRYNNARTGANLNETRLNQSFWDRSTGCCLVRSSLALCRASSSAAI